MKRVDDPFQEGKSYVDLVRMIGCADHYGCDAELDRCKAKEKRLKIPAEHMQLGIDSELLVGFYGGFSNRISVGSG